MTVAASADDSWRGPYPYFSEIEMMCPCGCKGLPRHSYMIKLVKVRFEYNAPLPVSSGYRCPKYDKQIGESGTGPHTLGLASDHPISNPAAYKLVALALKHGMLGIGIAETSGRPRHVHLDSVEGVNRPAIWSE
jgi:zinc D-Ala-D-Ala carboxypeptidase